MGPTLALVIMTLALGQSGSPAAAPEAVPAERVWAACWSAPARGVENLFPIVWLPGQFTPFGSSPSVNPEEVARKLLSLPRGRRSLMWSRYVNSFWGADPDKVRDAAGTAYKGPWADAAMSEIAKEWPRMVALIKYCKGDIDLLIGDCEAWGSLTNWGMTDAQIAAVCADPRWARRGHAVPSLAEMLPGCSASAARTGLLYDWNLAIGRFTADQMNEALWKPAVAAFPSLLGANYDGFRSLDRPAPDYNGHPQPHDNVFGNGASPALYGIIEQAATGWFIDAADPTRLVKSGSVRLGRGPWQSFLHCIQQARACVRGAPDVPLVPWVAFPSYGGDIPGTVGFPAEPRCHDEMLRHLTLLGCPALLYWNPDSFPQRDKTQFKVRDTAANDRRVDSVLSETNGRTLGRTSSPVDVRPISFLADTVLSGAKRRDGRYVWRLSVAPSVRQVRDQASGATTDFGDGPLGLWIETDSAVPPRFEVTRRTES